MTIQQLVDRDRQFSQLLNWLFLVSELAIFVTELAISIQKVSELAISIQKVAELAINLLKYLAELVRWRKWAGAEDVKKV